MGLLGRIINKVKDVLSYTKIEEFNPYGFKKVALAVESSLGKGSCSLNFKENRVLLRTRNVKNVQLNVISKRDIDVHFGIDVYRIWKQADPSNLSETIKQLSNSVINGEEVIGLEKLLSELETTTNDELKKFKKYIDKKGKISYIFPSENKELRADFITLESLIRARVSYGRDFMGYLNKHKFVDYYKRIDLRNEDEKVSENDPYITEEGTFHLSSLKKYGILKGRKLEPALV